jgi:hypothetical protein
MCKLYIIAHTWEGISLTIDTFHSPEKAVRHISELVTAEYPTKAYPDDDPEEYLAGYHQWVREENDNMCEVDVAIKVININQ